MKLRFETTPEVNQALDRLKAKFPTLFGDEDPCRMDYEMPCYFTREDGEVEVGCWLPDKGRYWRKNAEELFDGYRYDNADVKDFCIVQAAIIRNFADAVEKFGNGEIAYIYLPNININERAKWK